MNITLHDKNNNILTVDIPGAADIKVLDFDTLKPYLSEQQLNNEKLNGTKSILCAAFPYFTGENDGNLSLYARGTDYHVVLKNRLSTAAEVLKNTYKQDSFKIAVDSNLFNEVTAANLSGLTVIGKNGLAILPPYGSFVFLGFILCSTEFVTESNINEIKHAENCNNCNSCENACPTSALKNCDMDRCLSYLTQKKGELSTDEISLLQKGEFIWGCDICQKACPYNTAPKVTDIEEFHNKIDNITFDMLTEISERSFTKIYPNRAFTYRGAKILRRNLAIMEPFKLTGGC